MRLAFFYHEMRKDVSLEMVDLDQRLAGRKSQSLGKRHSDQQGAQQSGSTRECDGIDIFHSDSRLFQGLVHNRHYVLLMCP